MRTAKVISLSMPPDMEKEVLKIAKSERRTVSEVLREAFRQYSAGRDLTSIRAEGRKIAKRKKLKPDVVIATVRDTRREIKRK